MKLNVFGINAVSILLLNLSFTSNVHAFGVEAAMQEGESVVVAENNVTELETSNELVSESSIDALEKKYIGDPDSIDAGKSLYGNTCLFCHGSKGIGARAPTLVKNGFAPDGVNDNEYFINTIKYGKPGTIMGSFEGTLTETEMWEIISFLRNESEKLAKGN